MSLKFQRFGSVTRTQAPTRFGNGELFKPTYPNQIFRRERGKGPVVY